MTNNGSPERFASESLAQQVDALARRLDGLDRQNRRLTHLLVASVVLLGAAAATAQVAPAAVTGDRFVLVDAQNRTRATLDTASPPGGAGRYPVLTFLDPAGKPRLRLGLGSRGALLEIVDDSGKVRDYFGPFTARPLTQP